MNIVINGVCTKNCSFCFQNRDFKTNTQNMKIEKFEEILDWVISSGDHYDKIPLSILGGEPSLHPNFIDFLKLIIDKERNLSGKVFELLIITNGDLLDSYIDVISSLKDVTFLINISSMKTEDEIIEKLNKLVLLKQKVNISIVPAFTVTNESIIDKLKLIINNYSINEIDFFRVAFASNSDAKDFNFYLDNKKFIIEAYEFLDSNGIRITTDCSKIPICAFTKEEIEKLKIFNIARDEDNYLGAKCGENADILPSGDIIPCMPLINSDKNKLNFIEFNNTKEVYDYTNRLKHIALTKKMENATKCLNCIEYKTQRCFAGCIAMNLLPKD